MRVNRKVPNGGIFCWGGCNRWWFSSVQRFDGHGKCNEVTEKVSVTEWEIRMGGRQQLAEVVPENLKELAVLKDRRKQRSSSAHLIPIDGNELNFYEPLDGKPPEPSSRTSAWLLQKGQYLCDVMKIGEMEAVLCV